MPRDNRKENRAKAKAENENQNPTGFEIEGLLEPETDEDEIVEELEGEKEKEGEENKNALEGESDGDDDLENIGDKAAPSGAKKEGEEEAKTAEAKKAEEAEASRKAAEVATGEKTAEELAKEEEAKKAAPITAEPTQAEKDAKAAADKVLKDAEDAAKAAETPKTLSNEEAASLFTEWRGETEKLLAEHHYKLTEQDVNELNENPAAYIPKAMSRVYLDCISASFQQFVNYLPRMVHQVLEVREATSKQENEFFTAWPDLKEHKETVLRLGAAYRQSNPAASMQDFINEVGAQSMVALRLVPQGQGNGAAAAAAAAAEAASKAKGFKPATGTPAGAPAKQPPTNPFEQMAKEFSLETEELDDS